MVHPPARPDMGTAHRQVCGHAVCTAFTTKVTGAKAWLLKG